MTLRKTFCTGIILMLLSATLFAKEYHVSVKGSDANKGSVTKPFKTISAAAQVTMPGDVITVHEGTYRECINPPRGGESDTNRITYQAAKGEKVVIKGSEVIKGWTKVKNDTWMVKIPKTFFGDFNPYEDLIHGDWFKPLGRSHHTGAVYLNGHWLTEAAKKGDVFLPAGKEPLWFCNDKQVHDTGYLFNISSFAIGDNKINITGYKSQWGIQPADCSEGGKCIGYINDGDGLQFEGIDFGKQTDKVRFRVASATMGGVIELRLNSKNGELLGTCTVPEPVAGKHGSLLKRRSNQSAEQKLSVSCSEGISRSRFLMMIKRLSGRSSKTSIPTKVMWRSMSGNRSFIRTSRE